MKNSNTIPIAIVFGGILVSLSLYMSMPKSTYDSKIGHPELVRPVSSSDHVLGSPAAKVIIVEYSDFDCDYCKEFHQTMQQIIANEGAGGKVAWVLREFPLVELHPNAMKHAEAAECAAQVGSNDAFWKFANALYAKQPVDPSDYGTLAKAIDKLPGESFASCYANAATTVDTLIKADRQNALDMGSTGTPYSILLVSGRPPLVLSGTFSYDEMTQIVSEALAK